MAYNRLNLQNGVKLNADHLRHIEDGIDGASQEAARAVKTVNGQTPDESGNVTVEIPSAAASVASVNGKTGDVELSAEDVGAASREEVDKLSEEIVNLKAGGLVTETVSETGAVVALDVSEGKEIKVEADTTEVVTLVHQGKNWLPSGLENVPTKTENGITATANEDGSTTLVGTATGAFSYHLMHSAFGTRRVFPAGKYVATYNCTGTGMQHCQMHINKVSPSGSTVFVSVANNIPLIFELDEQCELQAFIGVAANSTIDFVAYCQIEIGGNATEYEQFKAEEHTTTLPSTVSSYAGTNILYTKTGEIIKASYEKNEADNVIEEVKNLLKFDSTPYGLPVLYLTGDTAEMTKDTAVPLSYEFAARTGTLTCKWQGNSSLTFPKKNYTLKFDNEFEAVDGWGAQKKYCTKANHNDFTQSRNVVSAKLWGNIVHYRTPKNDTLAACPNYGAIDGFPIVIVLNGEFHGVYCFNIPKDAWMMNMGSGTNECILCAELHVPATKFEAGNAVLDGSDFTIEHITNEDDTAWAVTSVNNLIGACANSDGSDLDTTIAELLDWDSAIDYYIYCVMLRHTDGLSKNYLLTTYDGVKWFFTAYDMDTVFGNSWDGKTYVTPITGGTFEEAANENHLFRLIKTYKMDELKTRYNSLRKNALSEAYIAQMFTNYTGGISAILMQEEARKWPTIPHTSVNTVDGILNWYRLRCQVIDAEVESWT